MIKNISIAIGVLVMLGCAREGIPDWTRGFAVLMTGGLIGWLAFGIMNLATRLQWKEK